MKKIILDFPKQFRIGFDSAKKIKIKVKFDGVCICGIGGSALPGNFLSLWLKDKKINLPLVIQRDYILPHQVKKSWLIICISYSGNTEEVLSCFQEARKKNFKIACITSGGKLEKLSKKYKIPCALVTKGIPPRTALGCQFSALLSLLKNAGLIKINPQELFELEKKLKPIELEKRGKVLAKKLIGKIPLIYSSNKFKILARLWKISFNENTKIPAFWNYFPELNHNEMVGFTKKTKAFYFIILQDKNDHPRIKKRIQLTKQILEKQGLEGEIIEFENKPLLEKAFSAIILANWTSYYLALNYKINPIPVKIVEELKKKMKK
jgi:glucose/mannose-6-phosphate isomerase